MIHHQQHPNVRSLHLRSVAHFRVTCFIRVIGNGFVRKIDFSQRQDVGNSNGGRGIPSHKFENVGDI